MESGAEVIDALQELTRASGKRVKCKPMAELSQMSKGADAITPRIELHADCYAGLRAGQSKITTALDPGDIKEALGAAGALGDDRLQERVKGFAVATSFSHRTRPMYDLVQKGLASSDLRGCDTLSVHGLYALKRFLRRARF